MGQSHIYLAVNNTVTYSNWSKNSGTFDFCGFFEQDTYHMYRLIILNKGQFISKCLFCVFNSSTKRFFFVRFLEELKTKKISKLTDLK